MINLVSKKVYGTDSFRSEYSVSWLRNSSASKEPEFIYRFHKSSLNHTNIIYLLHYVTLCLYTKLIHIGGLEA
jgi:hypothetical protein